MQHTLHTHTSLYTHYSSHCYTPSTHDKDIIILCILNDAHLVLNIKPDKVPPNYIVIFKTKLPLTFNTLTPLHPLISNTPTNSSPPTFHQPKPKQWSCSRQKRIVRTKQRKSAPSEQKTVVHHGIRSRNAVLVP